VRSFAAGAVTGAAAVAVAWWLMPATTRHATSPDPAEDSAPATERCAEAAPPVLVAPPPLPAAAPTDAEPLEAQVAFSDGVAVLRVGEAYVFGERAVRPRGETAGADVVCLEIAGGVVLRCPFGGATADVPLGAVGMPKGAEATAALVADAPLEMPAGNLHLVPASAPTRAGVGFARSRAGTTYRLHVTDAGHDADVLRRTARLVYVAVPTREGGGVVRLPTTAAADPVTVKDLQRVMDDGRRIPNASFTEFLRGEYQRLTEALPTEISFDERMYLVVDEPLSTTVEFQRYSGLVASRGVAPTGKFRIRSYTGVSVIGDMEGEIDVSSYAFVHVSGNLLGKVNVRSYATLVVDGDLVGEVDVSSYTTLLLRGRLLGTLRIRTSGSRFWFQQHMFRDQVEQLGRDGGGSSNELHLRSSDIPLGTHKDVAGWSSIAGGEDVWTVLAK
jgi:hypothetical protein